LRKKFSRKRILDAILVEYGYPKFMKRIFLAVDISEEARRLTAVYIENLRAGFRQLRIGWEKPEKLHLTLKFVGDTNEKQLMELCKITRQIAAQLKSFQLQISVTGVFPAERNPRVLWIGVKDEAGNLLNINKQIEAACVKIGFQPEGRKFIPHLTIARIREPLRARDLARRHLENKFEPAGFAVSEIVVYESKLLQTGSVYTVVSRGKFG